MGIGKTLSTRLEGRADEELQLTCTADVAVPPPRFQWRVAGRKIQSHNIGNTSRIHLALSRELDGVAVECSALHPALDSPLTTLSTLSVTFPPFISTSVNPKRALVEGDDVSLLCEALANPPPTSIIWKREGTGETIPSKDGKLILEEVDRVDSGRYLCQASNSEGLSEAVEDLVVYFPPSLVLVSPTSKVLAQNGQDLVLTCNADGLPPPSYTWFQRKEGRERWRGNSSSLTLTSISYADSGEWRCLASNSGGSLRSKPTELRVFGPPASLSAPGTVLGRVGQKLVITAGFCCHPPPSVDWVVADKTHIKEDSDRIAFSTKSELDSCYSSTLTFNQLMSSDSGEVVVEVANSEGGQRRVIMVEVVDEELNIDKDYEDAAAKIEVKGVVAREMMMRMEEGEVKKVGLVKGEEEKKFVKEQEEMKVKKEVELVKEKVEAPIEVIASLWVGGIATLTLLSLIILQVLRTSHWCRGRKSVVPRTVL